VPCEPRARPAPPAGRSRSSRRAEAFGAADLLVSVRPGAYRSTVVAGLLHTEPSIGSTAAMRFLALSLVAARRRLWITNAYFAPSRSMVRPLATAARRGVDVRILTANRRSDVPLARLAEATLPVLDPAVGRPLEAILGEDLRHAQEIDLASFRRRSLRQRGASMLSPVLRRTAAGSRRETAPDHAEWSGAAGLVHARECV
jgi:phosphatidylserine/phosphatidylglycerophosphate/cardiolipin synthase-like enzyme